MVLKARALRYSLMLIVIILFILAANTSHAATYYVDDDNEGDLLADGSEDRPFGTIEQGHGAASSGDTIRVFSGTYSSADEGTGIEITKRVELIGNGSKTTMITGSSQSLESVVEVTSSNVLIEGFRIDGETGDEDGIRLSGGNCEVRLCNLSDCFAGIRIMSSMNVIQNCSFYNIDEHHILVHSTINNVIDNCTFHGWHSRIWLYIANFNIVRNCIFYGPDIYIEEGSNNQIRGCTWYGGRVQITSESDNNHLFNCIFNEDFAYFLIEGNDNILERVQDPIDYEWECCEITGDRNRIINSQISKLRISGDDTLIESSCIGSLWDNDWIFDIKAENLTLSNCTINVQLCLIGSNHTIIECKFLDVHHEWLAHAPFLIPYMIHAAGATNLILRDNQMTNCSYGIYFDDDPWHTNPSDNITVIDCEFKDGSDGFFIGRSTNLSFINCTLTNISFSVNNTDPEILDTYEFVNCTLDGYPIVYLSKTSNLKIERNCSVAILVDCSDVEISGLSPTSNIIVYLINSDRVRFTNCTIHSRIGKMHVINSHHNFIATCGLTCIDLRFSKNMTIDSCIFSGDYMKGVQLHGNHDSHFDSHTIINTTIDGNPLVYIRNKTDPNINGQIGQLIAFNCSDIEIDGNQLSMGMCGVRIHQSTNISFTDYHMINHTIGIHLIDCSHIYLSEITSNEALIAGFRILRCNIISIVDCNFSDGGNIRDSSYLTIFNCSFSGDTWITGCNDTVILRSRFSNPEEDRYMSPLTIQECHGLYLMDSYVYIGYYHGEVYASKDVIISNVTYDVYYPWDNYLGLSCNNLTFVGCSVPSLKVYAGNSNTITQSFIGNLQVSRSRYINISNCSFNLCRWINFMRGCHDIEFSNNHINTEYLYPYSIVFLVEWNPSNLSIHHNNFLTENPSNQSMANQAGSSTSNEWDDGISEGNYWINYNGTDDNGDGIGDEPYEIDGEAENQDDYPLMEPLEIDYVDNVRPTIMIFSRFDIGRIYAEDTDSIEFDYAAFDADDVAQIKFSYRPEHNLSDNRMIETGIDETDGRDSFEWDISSLPEGIYYFIGRVDDGHDHPFTYTNPIALVIVNGSSREPPDLSIISPESDALVSDIFELVVEATDDGKVWKVEYRIDDGNWVQIPPQGGDTWSGIIDTATIADGVHDLEVLVTDDIGQATSGSIRIEIDNTPPDIEIIEPSGTVSGNVEFECEVDDAHIESVSCRVDNSSWGFMNNGSTWTASWDSTNVKDGNHTFEVEAIDAVGNIAIERIVFEVNNSEEPPPPTPLWITIDTPEDGSTQSGNITISGTAGDEEILDEIAISIFDSDIEERYWFVPEGLASWSLVWNSSLYPDSNYTIEAMINSTDDRSNQTSVDIIVNNTEPEDPIPHDNEPPEVEIIDGPSLVEAGSYAEFEVELSDPDGFDDISTVTITVKTSESVVLTDTIIESDWSDGTFVYIVDTESLNGTYRFEVTVEDEHEESADDSKIFVVQPSGGTQPSGDDESDDKGFLESGGVIIIFIGLLVIIFIAIGLSRRKKPEPIPPPPSYEPTYAPPLPPYPVSPPPSTPEVVEPLPVDVEEEPYVVESDDFERID